MTRYSSTSQLSPGETFSQVIRTACELGHEHCYCCNEELGSQYTIRVQQSCTKSDVPQLLIVQFEITSKRDIWVMLLLAHTKLPAVQRRTFHFVAYYRSSDGSSKFKVSKHPSNSPLLPISSFTTLTQRICHKVFCSLHANRHVCHLLLSEEVLGFNQYQDFLIIFLTSNSTIPLNKDCAIRVQQS